MNRIVTVKSGITEIITIYDNFGFFVKLISKLTKNKKEVINYICQNG